ncbi:lysosomal protective protein isoform X1 [Fasciola hepatica]|uniref:Carboxypeptidase n=1 Tax=Fasciola hepatica TaxID=6192 RepID=A0A4E0RK57_FASHE|nr:lysosomal protective protein isoform X1 [Fasciola hepatica]
MRKLVTAAFIIFVLIDFCGSHNGRRRNEDVVEGLPHLDEQPNFRHYSGYLSGSTPNVQLHYWFVESSNNSENDPLVLWLNGGPGCSSLEGFLDENGPFSIRNGPIGASLISNLYSWNKFSNVLYLEAPAGVGFSYAVDSNTTTDDDLTSLNNYHALLHFLEKYPEYKGRDFYITGESYAGVYVPTLALRVLQNKNDFHLKGIAVGNGLTSYQMNDNSLVYFVMYHALMDESTWSDLLEKCCFGQSEEKCMFTRNHTKDCQSLLSYIQSDVLNGLNHYNLYDQCAGGVQYRLSGSQLQWPRVSFDLGNLFRENLYVQRIRQLRNQFFQTFGGPFVLPCVDSTLLRSYLNLPEVRRALHVDLPFLDDWDVCSATVNTEYIRTYQELSAQYLEILKSGIPTLIYYGDVDMACNYFGGLWFVDSLNLNTTKPMAHWLYVDSDSTKQVGGMFKVLTHGDTPLWFVTIRGSGHMVPRDKPLPAFHLLRRFIQGGSL